MKFKRGFASDNNSGVHSEIMRAMQEINQGHFTGYGDDPFTEEAVQLMKNAFGDDVDVFFVLTGTGANVLGLNNMTESFNSIICAETAHINEDECGAPEKFTNCKLIPVHTEDGKLGVENIKPHVRGIDFEHHAQPVVVSITQVTEMGTLYQIDEIREIADYVHENNMYLHMDGARLSNAAVSLGVDFKSFTRDAGVDVLSFGITKNGAMYGESVIFFNKNLSKNFKYFRKQGTQLASKMRYISVQFSTMFKNDLWQKSASHANKMAKLLEEKLKDIPEVKITQKVEANGVFAIIPKEIIEKLQKEYFFYMWDEFKSEVRWMTSFDTSEEDILNFTELIKSFLKNR